MKYLTTPKSLNMSLRYLVKCLALYWLIVALFFWATVCMWMLF